MKNKGQPPLTRAVPTRRLYSLATTINIGLIILVFALLSLAVTTYTKLRSFEESLNLINQQSLPAVINSGQLYSQMNLLLSVTEQLSMANSEAMRRIAMTAINQQLSRFDGPSVLNKNDNYMQAQILSIKRELSELNELVGQKIALNRLIEQQQRELYELYNNEIHPLTLARSNAGVPLWSLRLSNIVVQAGELLTIDTLSLIRQQQGKLAEQILALNTQTEASASLLEKLSTIILSPENGLVSLRQSQLKILGRVQGRSNFVRNLISDYARLNEFESHQLNEAVMAKTTQTTERVSEQVKQVIAIFTLVLLVYAGFALFIHHTVVRRLNALRAQVQERSDGSSRSIELSGTDEITELAQSFEEFANTIEQQKRTLIEMSLKDSLTGIANRRAFDEHYLQALHVASRQQWPLTVMLLDVDYFKQYNDNYGHSQGDKCLKQVADLIKSQLPRKTDLLARYGGEEFAVLLPDTPEQGAITVADNILRAFKDAQIPHNYSGVGDHVTISIGISVSRDVENTNILPTIEEADKALYLAKRRGRNQWINYRTAEEE